MVDCVLRVCGKVRSCKGPPYALRQPTPTAHWLSQGPALEHQHCATRRVGTVVAPAPEHLVVHGGIGSQSFRSRPGDWGLCVRSSPCAMVGGIPSGKLGWEWAHRVWRCASALTCSRWTSILKNVTAQEYKPSGRPIQNNRIGPRVNSYLLFTLDRAAHSTIE